MRMEPSSPAIARRTRRQPSVDAVFVVRADSESVGGRVTFGVPVTPPTPPVGTACGLSSTRTHVSEAWVPLDAQPNRPVESQLHTVPDFVLRSTRIGLLPSNPTGTTLSTIQYDPLARLLTITK